MCFRLYTPRRQMSINSVFLYFLSPFSTSCCVILYRSHQVVELMSAVLEDLVGGEVMQMTAQASDADSSVDKGAFG